MVLIQSLLLLELVRYRLSSYLSSEVRKGSNSKMNPAHTFEMEKNKKRRRADKGLYLIRALTN